MINSQKDGLAHTDITQLLILAKGSRATDIRDLIYAFYGLTLLTTFPDYTRPAPDLYIEIILLYIENLLDVDSYLSWHNLAEDQRIFQLTSILYSAGALHQTLALPSWVPDWTYAWYLAPIWCKTIPNFTAASSKDEWSRGVRTSYRAGGNALATFEVLHPTRRLAVTQTMPHSRLRLSVVQVDTIAVVSDNTPASTPSASTILPSTTSDSPFTPSTPRPYFTPPQPPAQPPLPPPPSSSNPVPRIPPAATPLSATPLSASPAEFAAPWPADDDAAGAATLQYGRRRFATARGRSGFATEGVRVDDVIAVVPGADVPFVLRPVGEEGDVEDEDEDEDEVATTGREGREYRLLCECFVEDHEVMHGDWFERMWTRAEEIVLV